MNDGFDLPAPSGNAPVFTVTEIAAAVKHTVEETFGRVRVRGEISGFKLAPSGHAYLRLKDTDAVLDAVMWRGTMGKIAIKPEDGMEVIATGRLTTYAGKSSYQLVIESVELAGQAQHQGRLATEGFAGADQQRRHGGSGHGATSPAPADGGQCRQALPPHTMLGGPPP